MSCHWEAEKLRSKVRASRVWADAHALMIWSDLVPWAGDRTGHLLLHWRYLGEVIQWVVDVAWSELGLWVCEEIGPVLD